MTSKVLNLCSPGIGFDPDNESYVHCEEFRDAVYNFLCMKQNSMLQRINVQRFKRSSSFKDGEDPFEKTDEAAEAMNESEDNEVFSTVEHQELVLEPAS